MRTKHLTKDEKLSFFQDLYSEAEAAQAELFDKFKLYYEQYKGSKKIDGSEIDAKHVRNITYELIESQVTSYVPTPSVTPKMWSEQNERCAKSIETLLRNKRDELPFEKMNDLDERYSPIYGGSVWLAEWDESIMTHSTVGDVKLSCISPKHFLGQPCVYDIDDMEFCFIELETTKEDVMRKYGVSLEIAEQTESDDNHDERTATVRICFYKDDDDKVCLYIWSGNVMLSDIDDYYARKRKVCRKCNRREEICSCEKPKLELLNEEYEELTHDIVLSDGSVIPAMSPVIRDGQVVMETVSRPALLEDGNVAVATDEATGMYMPIMQDVQVPKMAPTKLPFYRPKKFPVRVRKNISEEDNLFGQSDCEFIRPQQQAVNKLESRILEKQLLSGVIVYGVEDLMDDVDNTLYKKYVKIKEGQNGLYGVIDTSVDTSRDSAQAERQYDHGKRTLGISDSFQGQYDSSAQSGKAKQMQIQQAQGRLDSKRTMKNFVYSELDECIFQYCLAYADEPRPVAFRDAQGRMHNVVFNRYDFLRVDEITGEWYYDDGYLFRTDASYDVERDRVSLWQENRQNFQSGAYGDPMLPQTQLIFWQNMEKAHYPWANDNVERIKEEIARQAEMAQLQGQIQNLEKEVMNRQGYEDYLKGLIPTNAGGEI